MFKVSRPCTLLSGYYVDNKAYLLLSFIVAKAMVVMGDTCVQCIYHGHTIIRLVIAICCCHLWIGGTCVQSITAIHTIIVAWGYLLLSSMAMAVMGDTIERSIIYGSKYHGHTQYTMYF